MTVELFSPKALAASLGISVRTLNRWHALRKGPARVQVGRLIGYRETSVARWLDTNEVQPVIVGGRNHD